MLHVLHLFSVKFQFCVKCCREYRGVEGNYRESGFDNNGQKMNTIIEQLIFNVQPQYKGRLVFCIINTVADKSSYRCTALNLQSEQRHFSQMEFETLWLEIQQ